MFSEFHLPVRFHFRRSTNRALDRQRRQLGAHVYIKSATKSATMSATKSGTKSGTKSATMSATKSGTKSALRNHRPCGDLRTFRGTHRHVGVIGSRLLNSR